MLRKLLIDLMVSFLEVFIFTYKNLFHQFFLINWFVVVLFSTNRWMNFFWEICYFLYFEAFSVVLDIKHF